MRSSLRNWTIAAMVVGLAACSQPAKPPQTGNNPATTPISGNALGGTGLTGEYFDNMDHTGTKQTRVDGTINFSWNNKVPITGIASTTYSVRWTGQIVPEYNEEYTYYVTHTDGARLMVNGQVLVNNWKDQAQLTDSGKVTLKAGVKYDIRLEYYRNATNAGSIKMEWQSASRRKQVVPMDRMFATGSNVQAAINLVQANTAFSALGVQIDLLNAAATVTDNGTGFYAREQASPNFYIGIAQNNSLSFLIRIVNQSGVLTGYNLLTGAQTNLGNASDYIDAAGGTTQQQIDLLRSKLELIIVDELLLPQQQVTGQGVQKAIIFHACPDGDCNRRWQDYRNALLSFTGDTAMSVAIGTYAGCKGSVWGCVGGAIGGGIVGAVGNYSDTQLKGEDLKLCMMGKDPDKLTNGDGCPPKLILTPASASGSVPVNSQFAEDFIIKNDPSAGLGLEVKFVVATGFSFFLFPGFGSKIVLPPGVSATINTITTCPSYPTTLSPSFSLTSNDPIRPTVNVTVTVECTPKKAKLEGPTLSTNTLTLKQGETKTITASIKNVGNASMPYSISSTSSPSLTAYIDQIQIANVQTSSLEPNQIDPFPVRVTCNTPQEAPMEVVVTANAGEAGSGTATLSVECKPQEPQITDPTPLSLSAAVNQTATGTATFSNTGTANLVVNSVNPNNTWLSVSNYSPTVAPDSSGTISFSATCSSTPGTYQGSYTINSNDPDRPSVTGQVTLICTNPPVLVAYCRTWAETWAEVTNLQGSQISPTNFQSGSVGWCISWYQSTYGVTLYAGSSSPPFNGVVTTPLYSSPPPPFY